MIAYHRVKALITRNVYGDIKNLSRLIDLLYWPMVDMLVWGFTSRWVITSDSSVGVSMLIATIFWQTSLRATLDIGVPYVRELWGRNLVSLFSTPVSIQEWAIAHMVMGCIKAGLTFLYISGIAWIFCDINVFSLGSMVLFFFAIAVLCGWGLGFGVVACLGKLGTKIESVPWMIPWGVATLSSITYSIDVIPQVLQPLSYCMPLTYFFEGLRILIKQNIFSGIHFIKAIALGVFYVLVLSKLFFFAFNQARKIGLSQLES